MFYRAVGLILKSEKLEQAERLLREYLQKAPKRSGYPRYAVAHEWLGRLYESKGEEEAAAQEYQEALQLDPKDQRARELVKRLVEDSGIAGDYVDCGVSRTSGF